MEKIKKNKNVIWNMIGATTNAFNSLLFTIIVTRINGLNDAGIFTYAFATACLLYVIGVYLGRTFQVTDIDEKNTNSNYVYNKITTCALMILVSILFVLIKGYDIYKSAVIIVLCGFKSIEALSEVFYAITQKNEQLYKVGISMTLKAVLGVVVFLVIDLITKNMLISCVGIVIINILFLVFYDIKNSKLAGLKMEKYDNNGNKTLLKTGFFTFILTFLGLYLINISRYAIDDLSTNEIQTIFGIIIMPATFMGLLGQFIIQPALTKFAQCIKNKEYHNLKMITIKIISLIIVLGMMVFGVAYFLGIPLLELVYGIELKPYFISFMIIILGSILYSIQIISSAILISMRRTFGQVMIYFIISIISTGVSYYLVDKLNILGASISYCMTMTLVAVSFILYLIYRIKIYKREWEKKKKKNKRNIS